jgi:spore germination protein YaaH
MTSDKAIFFDEREVRWRRTRRVLSIVAAAASTLLAVFAFAVFEGPELPPESSPAVHDDALSPVSATISIGASLERLSRERGASGRSAPLRIAFYVPDDPSSLRSLREHHAEMDVLAPVLLHAVATDGRVSTYQDDALADWLQEAPARPALMPVVDNFDGASWRGAEIGRVLQTAEARRTLVNDLESYASETHAAGILVDFEEIPGDAQEGLRQFARELATRLHGHGWRLVMALPALDATYDYAELGRSCDAIVLMNYDQHWEASTPGPIAAQAWYAANLTKALQAIPADKRSSASPTMRTIGWRVRGGLRPGRNP